MKSNKCTSRFDYFCHHCMHLRHSLTALWVQLTVMIFTFLWAQQFTIVPAAAAAAAVDVYYQIQRVAMYKKQQNNNNKNSQWTRVTQVELRDDCQFACLGCWTIGDAGQTVGHGNFIRDPTRLDFESFSIAKRQHVAHVAPKRMPSSKLCMFVCVCVATLRQRWAIARNQIHTTYFECCLSW